MVGGLNREIEMQTSLEVTAYQPLRQKSSLHVWIGY